MLLLLMFYAPRLRDLSATWARANHRTWANSWLGPCTKAEQLPYVGLTTLGFSGWGLPAGERRLAAALRLREDWAPRGLWLRAAVKREHPGSASQGAPSERSSLLLPALSVCRRRLSR